MRRIIAMLPTGDWCRLKDEAAVFFYEFDTDDAYDEFLNDGSLADARCLGRVTGDQGIEFEREAQ